MIVIELSGPPLAKGRPRFTRDGHAFTPAKTMQYEAQLAYAAQMVMNGRPPLDGPLEVAIDIFMPIPESKPKKWKAAALAGSIRPTKKPDADNFAKVVDGLNLIVWVDDSQIVDLHVRKFYSNRPRFVARVYEVTTDNNQQEGIFG